MFNAGREDAPARLVTPAGRAAVAGYSAGGVYRRNLKEHRLHCLTPHATPTPLTVYTYSPLRLQDQQPTPPHHFLSIAQRHQSCGCAAKKPSSFPNSLSNRILTRAICRADAHPVTRDSRNHAATAVTWLFWCRCRLAAASGSAACRCNRAGGNDARQPVLSNGPRFIAIIREGVVNF